MDKSDELSLLEKRIELSELFDFYGSLLKEGQREVFEDYAFNDLSISEIAAEHDMSRQAIFDMVKRCTKSLIEYDEKLGLIEKFGKIRTVVEDIQRIAESGKEAGASSENEPGTLEQIEALSEEILDIF